MMDGCLPDAELLMLALGDPASAQLASHLAGCANCRARLAVMVELLGATQRSADAQAAGDSCLDEVQLAEFASGHANSEARAKQRAHLADCGRCRESLGALVTLLAEPSIVTEIVRVQSSPSWRKIAAVGTMVVAAAAVVIAVGLPLRRGTPQSDHRGPTITASALPTPIFPVGEVASASLLRWALVPGADRYRVTLFNSAGSVLFEAQLSDTTVSIPDSVNLVSGTSYLWKVEARTEWDRWAASELMEFRVGANLIPARPAIRGLSSDSAPPGPAQPDSLHLQAAHLPDSLLAIAARSRPLDFREAIGAAMARAVHQGPSTEAAALRDAQRLAAMYASQWHDDFLVGVVARFVSWPAARRATKVSTDSLRRVGVAASSRTGAASAIRIWQPALARATAIGDTAGMAALLGNIGAALSQGALTDSASRTLDRARRLAVVAGDRRTEANALSAMANLREDANDIDGARQLFAQAMDLHERIGDSRGLASDYNNLSGLAQAIGDLPEARRQLEAALALNRRDGRPEFAATNLVNLATLASLGGDIARAESLYREALDIWRVRRQWADVADAISGLGRLEVRRGDYPAARVDLAEALTLYERTGAFASALAMRQELASIQAAQGQLQEALDALRETQRLADSAQVPLATRARITMARADLAVQLNSRPEAERLYLAAENLYRRAGDRAGEGEASQGHGALLLDEGSPARAQALLDAALRAELASGSQRAAAISRLLLGDLALRRGDTVLARRQLARAASDLEHLGDPVAAAAAIGQQAALDATADLPASAKSLYRAALARLGDRVAPEVSWRLHAGLGALQQAQGETGDAARELRAGIADLERTGQSLALPERRSGFFLDKWDVYLELARLEEGRGDVAAAFNVSERLRASEMREMLAQGRIAAPADTASNLVGREQDLRRRIGELTRAVEGDPGGAQVIRGPDVAAANAVSREALLRAQESYADLLLEMREHAPRHAALIAPAPAGWRDVSKRLGANEAFIEYLVSESSSLAFVITRDSLVSVPLVVGRHDLSRLIEFTRGTMQPRGNPRLDSLWRAPLRQLYQDLIAPIEASGLLVGKSRLTIVPHVDLHYLPFAALIGGATKERFLVERFDVAVTPSASVWLAVGNRPSEAPSSGVVAFAPRPDALPASRQEVAAVARFGGPGTKVLTGTDASEAAFRREAPNRRVIHLATYGVLNKQNPLFSFVEFAPGGRQDGRLEAHEVFGLRLHADLVVLSACQTALASGSLADIPAGDDWVGLARAFLSAGASRVMASLWPVQDRATAALMEQFYGSYRVGSDPAVALAAAQRALIANGQTAAPYYWAGFEVIGGR